MKRNFIFGIGLYVTGLGLLVSGLGLSLNAQAASVKIIAIDISNTSTTENTFNAIISYSTPNSGFVLDVNQDPKISFVTNTDTNTKEIKIDLFFVSPSSAPQATVVDAAAIQPLATDFYTANLGTLAADTTYDITAFAHLSNSNANINSASSLTTSEYIPPVPIPAAIWLFLSGIVPLIMIGRRKLRG